MKPRLLICMGGIGIICWLGSCLAHVRVVEAAEAKPARTQGTMDASVIRVDKYGVYVPNIVFYFDPETSKQRNDALAAAAQKLIGRKASITFSATADLTRDKHPLLVDIVPSKNEPAAPPPRADRGGETSKYGDETDDRRQFAPEPPVSGEPKGAVATGSRLAPDEAEESPSAPSGVPPGAASRAEPLVPPVVDRATSIRREEIVEFIEGCMDAVAEKDISAVLSCYADKVDYYSKGTVSREFVRKDKEHYFRRWDTIESSIDGNVVLIVTDQQDVKIAKFITSFNVRNDEKSVSGKAENIWAIQRIDDDLKIVDEKQRILRSETWQ